jgi:hypothetical protein
MFTNEVDNFTKFSFNYTTLSFTMQWALVPASSRGKIKKSQECTETLSMA